MHDYSSGRGRDGWRHGCPVDGRQDVKDNQKKQAYRACMVSKAIRASMVGKAIRAFMVVKAYRACMVGKAMRACMVSKTLNT